MFVLSEKEAALLDSLMADCGELELDEEVKYKKDCGSSCSGHCGESCQALCKSTCSALF